MAAAETWSPGSTTISSKPFKVTDNKMYGKSTTVSVPGTVNPFLKSIEIKTTNTGQVQYVIDNTTFNSIQEIANEPSIANAGYSAETTAALQSATQNALNTIATNSGATPDGTQPAPLATPQGAQSAGGTNTANTADTGPTYDAEDTKLDAFSSALPDLQSQVNASSYGEWYYPEDIRNVKQDRVFIQQLQYVTASLSSTDDVFAGSLSNRENDFATKSKRLGSVTLPMSNNLTESIEVSWGEDRLSSIAAGLMAGGVNAANLTSEGKLLDALKTIGSTAGATLSNAGIQERVKQLFAAKAAAGAIGMLGIQINPEAYVARRTGVVPNPNLELLFNGPKLKSFGLAFKLVARSSGEAHNIRNIIKFFKKGMSPIKGTTDVTNFFLGTPNVFEVKFLPSEGSNNELLSLPQFKTCALVRCEVNYTPDSIYAVYEDSKAGGSQPIAVTLQLGFAELTPVYNNDYSTPGDSNESVGPDRSLFTKPVSASEVTTTTTTQTTVDGVPTTPLPRQNVVGGPTTANRPLEAGISNIERYQAAQRAGFAGTFQQWLNQGQ